MISVGLMRRTKEQMGLKRNKLLMGPPHYRINGASLLKERKIHMLKGKSCVNSVPARPLFHP
jgi:hypothetical protein